ncbi:uncharacterized protein ACOB7L_001229 [Callospermophilus lateralis]
MDVSIQSQGLKQLRMDNHSWSPEVKTRPTSKPEGLAAPRSTSVAELALAVDLPGPRAPRRRPEPAPGRGSRGRGARARRGKGRGHGAVTWARALARRVHSPAAARQRTCRARRFPRRPGVLHDPRPEASGAGRPPRRRAAARAGRAAASSRAAPRRGASLSWGARLPSLAPAPGRQRSRTEGGKTLLRRAGGRERGLSDPSRSVTTAATTIRAVLLLPTCREDTEHARAETTSGFPVPFYLREPGFSPEMAAAPSTAYIVATVFSAIEMFSTFG